MQRRKRQGGRRAAHVAPRSRPAAGDALFRRRCRQSHHSHDKKTPQRDQVGAHRDEKAPKTGEVCSSVTHHAKPISLRRTWEARPTGVECTLTSLLARKMPEYVVVWYHSCRSACQEIKGEEQGSDGIYEKKD